MSLGIWFAIGGALLLTVLIARTALRKRSDRLQNLLMDHLRSICAEYERGFLGQVEQLSMVATTEARLRARLIGVSYAMQGYIDREERTKQILIPIDATGKWAIASGMSAMPLNIHGSDIEQAMRAVSTSVLNEMISGIHAHDIASLARSWRNVHIANGYTPGKNKDNDRRLDGWSLQSATAGMKCWAEIAAG